MVVVCLALLAERLQDHPDLGGLGVFAVVFAAIWSTWISFVIYANIASEYTRVIVLMSAAGLIALMTTTLTGLDERANVFAIAFVICRVIAARESLRTGRLLTSWPAVQLGGLSAIWIGSLWVDTPAKYWVWAAALALELGLGIARASDEEAAGHAMAARLNLRIRREDRAGRRAVPDMVPVRIRADHIGERLGLFVIIVLGEGVTEVIQAGSEVEWTRAQQFGEVCAFLLLVGLWWLIFHHRLGPAAMAAPRLRIVLPVHLVATGSLVLLASGIGVLLLQTGDPPEEFWRWIACGSLAVWFAVVTAAGAASEPRRRFVLSRSLPSAVAALAIGLLAGDLASEWVIALLLGTVAWTALAPAPDVPETAPA